jgi:hypothetical protein
LTNNIKGQTTRQSNEWNSIVDVWRKQTNIGIQFIINVKLRNVDATPVNSIWWEYWWIVVATSIKHSDVVVDILVRKLELVGGDNVFSK